MTAPPNASPPSRRYAIYALGIIFAANFLNYLDRFVASGSEKGIHGTFSTLKISEWDQVWGWVYTAFTLGYLVASPFVGALSDRHSRPRIFAACVGIWSLATLGCGIVREVWQLIACRVFIGVGEAGCLAIGPALVADFFEPRERGRAMAAFFVALPLGAIAGFQLAQKSVDLWNDWRPAFYFGGGPGLVLLFFILFLKDPPRGAHEGLTHGAGGGGGGAASLKEYTALFRTRTLVLNMLAQSLAAFTLVPLIHFGKEYFEADKGWAGSEITRILGGGMLAGMAGSILSGWLGDRLSKKTPGGYSIVAAAGFSLGLPLIQVTVHAESHWLSGAALIGTFFLYFACMPAVNAQIAVVTSPAQRSMAYAMAVFVLHILGDTLSPPLFGVVSGQTSRRWAFTIFPFVLLGSGVLCFLASRTAAKDVARLSEGSRGVVV